MRVNHNIASMTALRHLTNTAADTAKNLERLSSGLRINSARDSPAELMISENMRARIGSVDQAMRNTETSISMIQTAEGALSEVSSMLINMRQLAVICKKLCLKIDLPKQTNVWARLRLCSVEQFLHRFA